MHYYENMMERIAEIRDQQGRYDFLMSIAKSDKHVWGPQRDHLGLIINDCVKCQCMQVIEHKHDQYCFKRTLKYKPRGQMRWNPFVKLQTEEPPCQANIKSVLHQKNIKQFMANVQ